MDYLSEIAKLREKINQSSNGLDLDKREQLHREVCNELAFKRDQVSHLKTELQDANSKIFELNRELEVTKSLLKESEFTLKLALKKSSSLEDKLKEMNESYTNLKLKEEMKLSEIQILSDNIQKMALENHQLSREAEEVKDKLRYSRAFQDELEVRQTKINSTIAKISKSAEQLEQEHLRVKELEDKLENSGKFHNLSQLLMKENEKLKKENSKLENTVIENIAKYQRLYKLIKEQKVVNMQHENIMNKIKYLQKESQCKNLQEKNFNNEQINSALTATLNKEIETNARLIHQNEEYEARIQQLEKKINSKVIKDEHVDVIEVE
ncbi:coiled-coil domain-containing protein 89-like [Zophobas morio]|uniref:coiled-coil domain-containing protein 89-like n=1 Tax=Zophobas morio TaxID=2755281 RepID=UPI0030839E4F